MTQKWNLQDIRPANHREVRAPRSRVAPTHSDVTPIQTTPRHRRKASAEIREVHKDIEESVPSFEAVPHVQFQKPKRKSRFRLYLTAFSILAIFTTSVIVTTMTGGAIINVYPKNRVVTVNAEFIAYNERRPGELTFEVLTLEATGERQVAASGQETVQTQASGFIDVFKTTPGNERIIKNTRFESTNGKIYRVQESVTIPGATTSADGDTIPGKVTVEVFADEVGESFNLSAQQRFSVPGFKENNLSQLYNSIYAINPEPISGGFDGPRFIIEENELANARQELQAELKKSLLEKFKGATPPGFVTFDSATTLTFTELTATQYSDTLVTIREQAILHVPLFSATELAAFIAKSTILGYNTSESVRIEKIDELRFSYQSTDSSEINIINTESIAFKIVGNPRIIWTFNGDEIRNDLQGKEKTAHAVIMGKYPGIERSTIDIKPFWKRVFPETAQKIRVNEIIE
jgi:hypothetical protein